MSSFEYITADDPFEAFSRAQLQRRTSVKWNVPENALPMFIAEMDVQLAEPIVQAVHDAMVAGDTGYACGPERYAEAYRTFARARWGTDVDITGARGNGGVMPAIVELLRVTTDPGGTVIVTPPVYAPFFSFIEAAGRVSADAPLTDAGRLDFATIEAAFEAAFRRGGRTAMLIANPHNPTGSVCTRAELEQLAELARTWNVTVISDEIHSPLVYEVEHTPYASVDPRGVTVFSASKGFNLAGLAAALMIPGEDARDLLAAIDPTIDKTLGLVPSAAHEAAMLHGCPWLDSALTALDARRNLVTQLVSERLPGVTCRMPDATYLAWLDFSNTALADSAAQPQPGAMGTDLGVAGLIADRSGVMLSSGEAFGAGGENRARFNFATRRDIIEEAVERIATLL